MASKNPATVTEDCAVLSVMDLLLAAFSCLSRVSFGHHGPLIASGDKIGLRSKIKAQLRSVQAWDCDPWIGLTLDFPLGKGQKANDEAGFGVRYRGECYLQSCHGGANSHFTQPQNMVRKICQSFAITTRSESSFLSASPTKSSKDSLRVRSQTSTSAT